jgi:endoglucanase
MNFGDSMDAPVEGHWGWMMSAADFQIVRDAGFDHVRVPMRVSAHAGERPPYEIDARFARRSSARTRATSSFGLNGFAR